MSKTCSRPTHPRNHSTDSTRCFCSHGYANILGQMINHSCYIIGTCECRILCLMTRIMLLGYHPFCFHANRKSILDWDGVAAVPLKLSTISIAQSFFPERLQKLGLKLDAKLDILFQVPEYPQYLEIQEALGLYGRSKFERNLRRLKRNGLKRWNVFIDKFWPKLPRIWKKS